MSKRIFAYYITGSTNSLKVIGRRAVTKWGQKKGSQATEMIHLVRRLLLYIVFDMSNQWYSMHMYLRRLEYVNQEINLFVRTTVLAWKLENTFFNTLYFFIFHFLRSDWSFLKNGFYFAGSCCISYAFSPILTKGGVFRPPPKLFLIAPKRW